MLKEKKELGKPTIEKKNPKKKKKPLPTSFKQGLLFSELLQKPKGWDLN